jgi:lysophospholipase L1-like esterase
MVAATATWTCMYGSGGSPRAQAKEPGPASGSQSDKAAEAAAGEARASAKVARASTAGSLQGPRLRHEPDSGVLGLPIAVQDANGESLEHFHRALRRAAQGQGQARLLFYGASHVASDLFTGRIRQKLQNRYGDAGHGFVLPVQPWRHYRHLDVQIKSRRRLWETQRIYASSTEEDLGYYGLAGVAVETGRRGAWGEVQTSDSGRIGRKVGLFDLFYWKQPGGGDFDVLIDGERVRTIETDAPEAGPGYAVFDVEDGAHRFRIRTKGNGKVRIFGVAMERNKPGVMVDTVGIPGARASYQLLWKGSLYREHLRRRDPDLVVLAYGTNESGDTQPMAQYEADLRKVIRRVQETVPQASCLLIGPSDRPIEVESDDAGATYENRTRTGKINRVQHDVALDMGCGYFDLVAFQGGPLSMVEWASAEPAFGAPDHVHYTVRGYRRLGEVLLGALLEDYEGPAKVPAEGDKGATVARRPR